MNDQIYYWYIVNNGFNSGTKDMTFDKTIRMHTAGLRKLNLIWNKYAMQLTDQHYWENVAVDWNVIFNAYH